MTGRCPFRATRIYSTAQGANAAVVSLWKRKGERWEVYSCPYCMELHLRPAEQTTSRAYPPRRTATASPVHPEQTIAPGSCEG